MARKETQGGIHANLITALAAVIGARSGRDLSICRAHCRVRSRKIRVAFIAWASFFGAGGSNDAIAKSPPANLCGAAG
jgi:Protein of unknown function (DUF1097)